ncbi:MAG TPA: hypothetical protein VF668_09475 [Pyrinomonadaceae bacterium]|jgi:hypothetical protein
MRHAPRNAPLALALLLACGAAARAPAQTATRAARGAKPARESQAPAGRRRAPDATGGKAEGRAPGGEAASRASADKAREARARAERSARKAVAVLLEVAGEAASLEDAFQRARVLTLCAGALWGADERAARSVFGRAWEAAVESDEAEFKDEKEQGRYGDLPERFTRARELALASAARLDARMSEAWLGALAEWVAREAGGAREEAAPPAAGPAGGGPDIGPLNEFTREGQRLALAGSLLEGGSYEDAARVAAPALQGGVSGAFIEFLLRLREGSPAEADRLYLRLLASTRARPDASANDVLLLSSYALTPRLLAVVGADGSVQFRALGDAARETPAGAAATAAAEARSVFYDTAASVLLLRPAQDAAPGREPHAVYFAIGRLLPFFEREAPRHAHALQARMIELAARLGLERRVALDSKMRTHSLSPENPVDPLRRLLDAAADLKDSSLRDGVRLRAVEAAAARRLWERARSLAEEVEDSEARQGARATVDAYKVAWVRETFEGDDDDFERAAALAREADVPAALRAYGLAQAAQMAARRGLRQPAAALLGEAFGQASQAEAPTYARDAALLLTATYAARLEWPRAWEALAAAVAALNQDEEFDGEPLHFDAEERADYGRGVAGALGEALRHFDLAGAFDAAARRDFDRAVAEARNLKSAPARALALVAAARVGLEKAGRAPAQLRPGR